MNGQTVNIAELIATFDALRVLTFALAVPMGIWAIVWAVMKLPSLGGGARGASAPVTPAQVAIAWLAGIFMLYFPTTLEVASETIFDTHPFSYAEATGSMMGNTKMAYAVITYVRTVGIMAALYGLWLFFRMGSPSPGLQVSGGKVLSFLIAGILAFRIDAVNDAIAFFGFDLFKFIGYSG